MRKRITIDINRALELLSYDPETGAITWRAPVSNRVRVGEEAGVVAENGRRYIGIDHYRCMAHRLAWAMAHGEWSEKNIVSINGNYLDARLSNLREETYGETARKGKVRGGGSSGVKGVSFDKSRNRWIAHVTRDYKRFHIGQFATKEEAVAARQKVDKQHNFSRVSDEERENARIAVAKRARQLRLWRQTLRKSGGVTGWKSITDFIADVGAAPAENHEVAPIDANKIIGPENFQWVAAIRGETSTPEGRANYNRAYRERYWLSQRGKALKKSFGIDLETYHRMHDAQDGKCAICGQPERMMRGERQAWLAVDHDHKTGAVRDLLCTACNRGIGVFEEDTVRMARAIAYLKRHTTRKT